MRLMIIPYMCFGVPLFKCTSRYLLENSFKMRRVDKANFLWSIRKKNEKTDSGMNDPYQNKFELVFEDL